MARVPLSKIELDEDEMIVEGFEGELEGIRVWVTAVLERTCVYETPGLERRLVNKSKVLVEREQIPIRRRRVGGPPAAAAGAGDSSAAAPTRSRTQKGGRGRPGRKPAEAEVDLDLAPDAESPAE